MRHRKATKKLGRSGSHRDALIASLACGLILDKRIRTTVAKAKLVRPAAEKLITMARRDSVAARRLALARLRREDCVHELFTALAPRFAGRPGGYTRIVRLGTRTGDGAEMVLLEWVDVALPAKAETKSEDAEAA